MKLVYITYHFQFSDAVEEILDRHGVPHFSRVTMVQSKDRDGRHYGNKIYPGSSDLVLAMVKEERLEDLFEDLGAFRQQKESHRHLEAVVLGVERRLGEEKVSSEQ